MKSKILTKLIIRQSLLVVILLTLSASCLYLFINKSKIVDERIKALEGELRNEKLAVEQRESKKKEVEKYRDYWASLPKNRFEISTIKLASISDMMNKIAEKHSVVENSIQLSLPNKMVGGVFDTKELSLYVVSGKISYKSFEDMSAIAFLKDFISYFPGYVVIESLELSKMRDYNRQDFIDIAAGKMPAILVNATINWYYYKDPEDQKLKQ